MVGCLGRGCEYSGPNRAGNFLSSRTTATFSGRIRFCGMCLPSNFRFTYYRWGIIEIKCTWCFVFFTGFFSTNFIQTSELNKCAYLQLQVENPIKIQWWSIWFCIYILMITVSPYHRITISPLFLTAVESELYFLSFMEGPVHIHLHHYNCESSYMFTLQMAQFRAAVCVCENCNGVRMTCHWDLKSDNVRT
jgi:hypothetical protein